MMRVVKIGEDLFLEHQERRVPLDATDIRRLKNMTPLGRKVHFRNKGMEMRRLAPEDERAAILIDWFRIPASEWSFRIGA